MGDVPDAIVFGELPNLFRLRFLPAFVVLKVGEPVKSNSVLEKFIKKRKDWQAVVPTSRECRDGRIDLRVGCAWLCDEKIYFHRLVYFLLNDENRGPDEYLAFHNHYAVDDFHVDHVDNDWETVDWSKLAEIDGQVNRQKRRLTWTPKPKKRAKLSAQ